MRVISSAPFGGGLGARFWILNAQVPIDYDRTDLPDHLTTVADTVGLRDAGTGMLTAADVTRVQRAEDMGVDVWATVGVRLPTYAAAPDDLLAESVRTGSVGTINIVAWCPAALSPAALVNAVSTVTEAKVQALFDAAIPGTGTATDAVVVACPDIGIGDPFGGPRSTWGSRLARATYAAVVAGARA